MPRMKKLGAVRPNEPCVDRFGASATRSRASTTPAVASTSAETAVIETGMSWMDSVRRVAVTTTSSSTDSSAAIAAGTTPNNGSAAETRNVAETADQRLRRDTNDGFMLDTFGSRRSVLEFGENVVRDRAPHVLGQVVLRRHLRIFGSLARRVRDPVSHALRVVGVERLDRHHRRTDELRVVRMTAGADSQVRHAPH